MKRKGGAALVLYIVVALCTAAVAGRRFLPVFEGFTPPQPYHWVKPPQFFAPGNSAPQPASASVAFASGHSNPLSLATTDGQCSVSLAPGSLPLYSGDDHVAARLTPIDPGALGPLPSGLYADGNAYRMDLTSEPSGQPIAAPDTPGNLVFTAPEPIRMVLFSDDGRSWQALETHPVGDGTVGAALLPRGGIYLAAAAVDPATAGAAAPGGHTAGTILVVLLVIGLAVAFLLIPPAARRLLGRTG